PAFTGSPEEGLPALRDKWIRARGDVAEHHGREVKPQDNGYLSGKHAEYASKAEKNRLVEFPGFKSQRRRTLRARPGKVVTPLPPAHPRANHPRIRPLRSRRRPRHHPEQHQSPRV